MKLWMSAGLVAASLITAAPAFAQPDTTWNLDRRENWLQERIARGRADGSLDGREARSAELQLQRIREQQSDLVIQDGGALSPADLGMLEGRLDALNDRLHWLRANNERRPW